MLPEYDVDDKYKIYGLEYVLLDSHIDHIAYINDPVIKCFILTKSWLDTPMILSMSLIVDRLC